MNVIDKSVMEKARTVGQLGETRTWGGKEYIKTAKGWRPKPKGGSKSGSGDLEEGVKQDTKKTEGSGKEKKLTVKERDSQNISKVKDILKNVGISKNADVRVHRGSNGQRFYTYFGGGHVPYQFTLRDTGDFTLRDGGIANIMGKIDNEADVKKMNTYVKGNEILNKMRSALKEDQGSMAALVKELQGLL